MSLFFSNTLMAVNDTAEENSRTRALFEEYKKKAIKNEYMTEVEKNDFCLAISVSRLNDGIWENYACCDDFKFFHLYLTYYKNIAGGIEYYKTDRDRVSQLKDYEEIKNSGGVREFFKKVEAVEVDRDLDYLYQKADEWDIVMQKRNHSDSILKYVSNEARIELKGLDKHTSKSGDKFAKGKLKYKKERRAILVHMKYLYLNIKAMLQIYNASEFILTFFNDSIHIDIETIIHVMNRHFAEIIRQYPYENKKTYHTEDIDPKKFHLQLKDIFDKINEIILRRPISLDRIVFKLKNIFYYISIGEASLFVKRQPMKIIKRVQSFYPVEKFRVEKILTNDYDEYILSNDLTVYLHSI